MDPSLRRRIGSTDLEIPILGLGTAPIGGLYGGPVPDADAVALIQRAYELGIRAFDTAPEYGKGFAEARLGEVLPALPRDQIVVSTKVGKPLRPITFAAKTKRVLSESLRSGDVRRIAADAVRITRRVALGRRAGVQLGFPFDRGAASMETSIDFSYDGVMRSVDDSLVRLGLSRVDILYIHEPDDHYDEALGGAFKALDRLRSDGTVRAIGVGMNQTQMLVRIRPRGPGRLLPRRRALHPARPERSGRAPPRVRAARDQRRRRWGLQQRHPRRPPARREIRLRARTEAPRRARPAHQSGLRPP